MSPGLVSSHCLMAFISFSVAPPPMLSTMSVTMFLLSAVPLGASPLASPVPIMADIMLAMSTAVFWMVRG